MTNNAQIAKTKILKIARFSTILTVLRSDISTFVIIFPFDVQEIHCEGMFQLNTDCLLFIV
jgi:hypothetical protein